MKKIGVVLSGGGIRGVAHIGFLKFLEEEGITPDYFAGASAGSIVGALAASGHSSDKILEIAKENKIFSAIKPSWPSLGLTALDKLPSILSKYIDVDRIEELPKMLAISASCLTQANSRIFTSGPLFTTVQASCSIPVIFRPVEIDDELYVDGGLLNNIPAQGIRDQADVLLGFNLVPGNPIDKEEISSIFKLAMRTFELAISSSARDGADLCDVLVASDRVENDPIFYSNNIDKIYEKGYQAAQKRKEDILAACNSQSETSHAAND
ncbi:MAG TPA: patatin-like phospholipase family protein [Bacteroidales bacterium]|nr:patatin-like phospholipase family protein [Bacteroidales bacterium]